MKARVKITPGYRHRPCETCDGSRIAFHASPYGQPEEDVWSLAIGDTLHLTAAYVDVDGWPLDEQPRTTWSSSKPDVVGVSPDGEVVGLAWPPGAVVEIVASTTDGTEHTYVVTSDAVAGLPASLRFAHAAVGAGPVTFTYNRGEPVRLSFGEWIDIPITSGLFYVDIERSSSADSTYGYWQSFGAIVREDDHLAIYAVNGREEPFLAQPGMGPPSSPTIR